MDRRQFLSATTVTGTTLLAGCGASTDNGTAADDGTPGGTETAASGSGGSTTGSFRLLISDRPADIADFDSLDVTFDRARVHRQNTDDEDDEQTESESETETETAESTATETEETETAEGTEAAEEEETAEEDDETAEEDEAADGDDGGAESEKGFTVFDLDSPTVDLTQVVGDKAIGVLDGKLETGQYSKIELYVSGVEGIVDGQSVPVKVPSNKLQITKSFEITADGTVEFVFDINVVKKGQGGYNLLPVISESGVAGTDVDVEEVDPDEESEEEESETESETEETESDTETTEGGTETAETETATATDA